MPCRGLFREDLIRLALFLSLFLPLFLFLSLAVPRRWFSTCALSDPSVRRLHLFAAILFGAIFPCFLSFRSSPFQAIPKKDALSRKRAISTTTQRPSRFLALFVGSSPYCSVSAGKKVRSRETPDLDGADSTFLRVFCERKRLHFPRFLPSKAKKILFLFYLAWCLSVAVDAGRCLAVENEKRRVKGQREEEEEPCGWGWL